MQETSLHIRQHCNVGTFSSGFCRSPSLVRCGRNDALRCLAVRPTDQAVGASAGEGPRPDRPLRLFTGQAQAERCALRW